jgi:hypothetical protein
VKSNTWDDALLGDHRAHLLDESTREAFDALVTAAIELPDFETGPAWHGSIRDFRYFERGTRKQPFAFIVNRRDLLFYVRLAGLGRVPGGFSELQKQFSLVAENPGGEWTVRIASREDAERLNSFLFSYPSEPVSHEASISDGITREDVLGLGAIKRKLPADRSWRMDPKTAGEMLEEILSAVTPHTRHLCIEALKHSVDFAKERYAGRWVLTLHPNYVRFIAGMVMCLQLRRDGRATLLLSKDAAPGQLTKGGGQYKNAPGCAEKYLSLEELAGQYSVLRLAHEAAIEICATTHAGSEGHRQAHSPGLAEYLDSTKRRNGIARAFTHYWKNSTWKSHPGGDDALGHTASNEFRVNKVRPGDRIFIVTNIKGVLHLGGVLLVDRIVGQREAERVFGEKLWPAKDHAIGRGAQAFYKGLAVPLKTVKAIRFSGGKAPVFRKASQLDQQTLRGIRELTPESARLMEELLQSALRQERDIAAMFPNEIEPGFTYTEGARKQVTVNAYERDPKARMACISHHGYNCAVCGFNFEARYGDRGREFTHVHHLRPMALTNGEYQLNPIEDLLPVCPNCHAMLHRGENLMSIEELRGILRERERAKHTETRGS